MSNNNDNGDDKGPDPRIPRFNFNNRIALISLLILVSFFIFFFVYNDRTLSQELSYSAFQTYLDEGQVDSVKIIDQYEIQGTFKSKSGETNFFKTTIPYPDNDLMKTLKDKGVKVSGRGKGRITARGADPVPSLGDRFLLHLVHVPPGAGEWEQGVLIRQKQGQALPGRVEADHLHGRRGAG